MMILDPEKEKVSSLWYIESNNSFREVDNNSGLVFLMLGKFCVYSLIVHALTTSPYSLGSLRYSDGEWPKQEGWPLHIRTHNMQ